MIRGNSALQRKEGKTVLMFRNSFLFYLVSVSEQIFLCICIWICICFFLFLRKPFVAAITASNEFIREIANEPSLGLYYVQVRDKTLEHARHSS